MSRSVSAVSMARSEYGRCPPRWPTPTASQVAIASGANHTVISPRWTSARSYAGQFPDVVFCLVLRVHARLHVEIMHLPSLRWPGSSVAHRGRGIRAPTPNTAAARHVLPTPTASQVAIASGANHTVISPRWTSARSYAGQFPTWYCVLYFGCTLDFMSRSCTCCRHDGQEVDRGSPRARDPCTNACAGKARSRGTRCRDVIFETLFETLWVSNPIRPRSATSRNRVMRGPGVTQGAKRSQGVRRPRD